MFGRKCSRCGKKIGKDYSYCPYCGNYIGRNKNNWNSGLIDDMDKFDFEDKKRDMPDFNIDNIKLPFGFNRIFKSMMKNFERQFREMDEDYGREKIERRLGDKKPIRIRKGLSISIKTINGKPVIKIDEIGKDGIKVRSLKPGVREISEKKPEIKEIKNPSAELTKKFSKLSKLPKKEALTSVRRLTDKILYEIELPGVKSMKDIMITKLQNSIEIKAFSKDQAFFKLIPVGLPILKYYLEKQKLILELKPEG